MSECMITHTDYDPPLAEFHCPKCGAKHGRKFGVSDGGGVGQYGCDKLHLWDHLDCTGCGWTGYGDEWVKLMGKDNAMEEWCIIKAQKTVGPFKLEVAISADGLYCYNIFWHKSSTALAGGKGDNFEKCQEAAESTIREWLENAREML